MQEISIEYCVEDALRRGLSDEVLFQSVMARISRPGVVADWGKVPVPHPFWYEGIHRDQWGRALSKKQTEAAINRALVGFWEEHLLNKREAEALAPQVFSESEEVIDSPLGTLTALDEGKGWDVTLAQRVRRKPIEKVLLDLEPILRSLAKKARRVFSLEQAHEDDLKQEARIKIANGLHKYEGRGKFETWAYRVAWRAMVDMARPLRRIRHKEGVGADDFELEAKDELRQVDDRLALWPILLDALTTVPDAGLVVLQALDYKDSEISDQNLRMKRHRARMKLADQLVDEPEVAISLGTDVAADSANRVGTPAAFGVPLFRGIVDSGYSG
jgi:DNA-directed RNA polymerase specialized sigma24 family protein